jgi:ribosomal protein L28
MRCYNCGKTIIFGRSHTHHRGVAGGRWKKRAPKTQRIFEPNLVRVNIIEKGRVKRVTLCSKCLKRVNKDMADGKKPFLQLTKPINLKKHADVIARSEATKQS